MRRRLVSVAPLALIAYVPLLLTAPGRVAADTKTYLYLDPAWKPAPPIARPDGTFEFSDLLKFAGAAPR